MHSTFARSVALPLVLVSLPALAQYTPQAGKSAPAPERASVEVVDRDSGQKRIEVREQAAPRDGFGHAQGARYALAVDGAFDGQTILIVDFYSDANGQDFSGPKDAVREKGFSM